jgi:hypothetical protein
MKMEMGMKFAINSYEKTRTKNFIFKGLFYVVFGFLGLLTGCVSNQPYCRIDSSGTCAVPEFPEPTLSRGGSYGYPLNGFAGNLIRRGEDVQQIWIGPYEDRDGNFHEPSYVYAVVKNGAWIGDPEKAIQD